MSALKRLLSQPEIEYLTAMKRTGLYGGTIEEVVRSLVLSGIQDAVRQGFIPIKTFPDLDDNEPDR